MYLLSEPLNILAYGLANGALIAGALSAVIWISQIPLGLFVDENSVEAKYIAITVVVAILCSVILLVISIVLAVLGFISVKIFKGHGLGFGWEGVLYGLLFRSVVSVRPSGWPEPVVVRIRGPRFSGGFLPTLMHSRSYKDDRIARCIAMWIRQDYSYWNDPRLPGLILEKLPDQQAWPEVTKRNRIPNVVTMVPGTWADPASWIADDFPLTKQLRHELGQDTIF